MVALPWTSGPSAPAPGEECVLLVSHLPLAKRSATLTFFRHVAGIRRQLSATEGLIGFALDAHPVSGQYWTLSAWRSPADIDAFVGTEPHRSSMGALHPALGTTSFTTWRAPASELPPSWSGARARLHS